METDWNGFSSRIRSYTERGDVQHGERGTPTEIALQMKERIRMARLYTTEEAYKKLAISQATFYRWVTEVKNDGIGEKIEPQPSIDGRERLYTLSQLRWLGTRHGKELLSDEDLIHDSPSDVVDALRRDIEHLQRLLSEKEVVMKTAIEQLEQKHLAMDARVQEAYAFCVQQVGLATAEMERIREEFGRSSVARTPTSTPLATLSQREGGSPLEQRHVGATMKKRYTRTHRSDTLTQERDEHTWSQEELFQENWIDETDGRLVSRARMAKAHNIPETNLRRDIEDRKVITMVEKRWLYKGAWKTGGFTVAQRRRVWEEYHDMPWFHPCKVCIENQHMEN